MVPSRVARVACLPRVNLVEFLNSCTSINSIIVQAVNCMGFIFGNLIEPLGINNFPNSVSWCQLPALAFLSDRWTGIAGGHQHQHQHPAPTSHPPTSDRCLL